MVRSLHRGALAAAVLAGAASGGVPNGGEVIGRIIDAEPGNNTPAGASDVVFAVPLCGAVIAGECVLAPGDVDHFNLRPAAGERLAIMTVPLDALPESFETPDTIVELLVGAGVVESNDDGGDDFPQAKAIVRGSAIQHVAASSALHTLRVSLFAGAAPGRYLLVAARVPGSGCVSWEESASNDSPATADELALQNGPLVVKAGSAAGNADYFSVAMETGDVLAAMTIPTTTMLDVADTILDVIAPDGVTVLASNDDADPVDHGSAVRFRAPATGTYYLRETHFITSPAGAYALVAHLARVPHCSGDSDGDGEIDFADITDVLKNFGLLCR